MVQLSDVPVVNQRYARSILSNYLNKNIDGTPVRDRERVLAVAIWDILNENKRTGYKLTKIDRILAGMLYPEFMAGSTEDGAIILAEQLRRALVDWASIDEDRLRHLVES